ARPRRTLRCGLGDSGARRAVAWSRRNASSGMSDDVRQFTVQPDDDGIRLARWFKRHLPQGGFATESRWARTGQVRSDGKRAKPEDRVVAGQVVRVPPGGDVSKSAPKRTELTAEQVAQARAMVIYEDDAAIVLNKLPGLATQGGTKT